MVKKSNNSNLVRSRIPDPTIWDEFLLFVEDRYKTKYAVTGIELQKALKTHLGMNDWKNFGKELEDEILNEDSTRHTHNASTKAAAMKMDAADKLLIRVINERVAPGTEVYFNVLSKWITSECGLGNRRTHKSHVDILVANGFLKDLEGNYTAYEVLDPGDP